MKKLIIGAVAFGLAVAVQAAQMNWTYEGVSSDMGNTVYAILGATVDTSNWKSAADIANIGSATVVEGGTKFKTYTATGTAVSDDMTYSSNLIFAMVTADGKQYALTSAVAPGEPYIQAGQDPAKGTYVVSGFGAFKDFQDVPEPTSGMLLLLGVAGLALRRRRA